MRSYPPLTLPNKNLDLISFVIVRISLPKELPQEYVTSRRRVVSVPLVATRFLAIDFFYEVTNGRLSGLPI